VSPAYRRGNPAGESRSRFIVFLRGDQREGAGRRPHKLAVRFRSRPQELHTVALTAAVQSRDGTVCRRIEMLDVNAARPRRGVPLKRLLLPARRLGGTARLRSQRAGAILQAGAGPQDPRCRGARRRRQLLVSDRRPTTHSPFRAPGARTSTASEAAMDRSKAATAVVRSSVARL